MPGTDTPRLFQGAFRQLNKFFVVISVNLYLTRGHYISAGIFSRLKYMERRGSGFKKILTDYEGQVEFDETKMILKKKSSK